jgi:hypothetical protein
MIHSLESNYFKFNLNKIEIFQIFIQGISSDSILKINEFGSNLPNFYLNIERINTYNILFTNDKRYYNDFYDTNLPTLIINTPIYPKISQISSFEYFKLKLKNK